mgnify:FL=1
MIIPKLMIIRNIQCNSCKVSRRPITRAIPKIKIRKEATKDSSENDINRHIRPKNYEFQNIKVYYRPIHPTFKFNSSSIDINEMVKKDNASLITNDSIRKLLVKFREEREKEMNERKVLYKDKSYQDIQKEKNKNFLMLRAMLRKDPLTIEVLMRQNRDKEQKKLNKCTSMKAILKYKKDDDSQRKIYLNKSTILPRENLTSEKNNTNNNSNILNNNNSSINNYKNNSIIFNTNRFSKKDIWKKDFLLKKEKAKKSYLKKYEAKITCASSLILPGHLSVYKAYQNRYKKYNQDCTFSYYNLYTMKLDEISLFGIIDGNGPYGKAIALGIKNYIINYFKVGNDMRVTLKKDNFYSIMYNSFINAQKYLINNSQRLNINLTYSGATGIVLLYPHNNTNKVYCANLGRNKCVFYTMVGALRLSYELFPNRASERFRISLFKKQNSDKFQNEQNNNINIIDNNNQKNNQKDANNHINNNNMMLNNNYNDIEERVDTESKYMKELEKEMFFKEFNELDISRCVGNLAAEDYGIIPGPEVVESDIRLNKGKFIVMGTESLWKYLNEDEVGEIVNKHFSSNNSEDACKDLQDLAKERWKEKTGGYDDISVVVIFFDSKNL